jgi:hypothetical protein
MGFLIGAAALTGGPVARAGIALIAAASELMPNIDPFAESLKPLL